MTRLLPALEDLRDQRIPGAGERDVMVEALKDAQKAPNEFQERLQVSYDELVQDCLNDLQAVSTTRAHTHTLLNTLTNLHPSTTHPRTHACMHA